MYVKKSVIVFSFVGLLVLGIFNAIPVSSWVYPDCTEDTRYEKFGPRCDRLLIQMYSNLDAECAALQRGDIDIIDWPLTMTWINQFNVDPSIKLVEYGCDLDEIVLEINNNPNQFLGIPPNPSYLNPVYPNPCSVSSFRHALAHLMDRNYIIINIDEELGIPMYTEVPPCLGPYQHPEINPGGALADLTHPYDPAQAAALLDMDGFLMGPDGWRYWDRNGNSVKDPGEDLILRFVIRVDDYKKLMIGDWYAYQLESDPIKIRVDRLFLDRIPCIIEVMDNKNFHLFTGDRNLRKDPDYLYEMKHSQMYWHPGICPNYIFFNDTEYDYWAEELKFATDFAGAVNAAHMCQVVYATPCKIGSIPIECRAGIKAMRRCYSGGTGGTPVTPDDGENQYRCQSWKGFVNGYWAKCSCGGAKGINSWWTFLNAYPEGHLMGDCEHMTIRYGFSTPMLWSLNPIYAHDYWEWEVLNKIYDTLLKEDPYTLEDMPWIAKNWTVGTWTDPRTGEVKTKIRFTLDTCKKWQDGTSFSAADVKFTVEELPEILASRGYPPPWWHQKVKFVKTCDIIDPCNVEILFDVMSIWALHWISELKILPKHIWKPIVETGDPTVVDPDPNLIGCGPWRLVEYVPTSHVLLVANKPCSTVQTNLPGSIPIHSPYGYFQRPPIHVNIHISDPPEYSFRQKVPPCIDFAIKVTLHNEWVNPIPNTAEAPPTGLLIAHKYVWLIHPCGTEELLAEAVVDLPYCQPHEEYFWLHPPSCHHQVKVAVHIIGPEIVPVTKEGGIIEVRNPWICQWINCTFDFWVTIKEDICGTYYINRQVPAPDCKVNLVDVGTAAEAFGSYPGRLRWNSVADVNGDYKIDIKDIVTIANKYGWVGDYPSPPPPPDPPQPYEVFLVADIPKTVVGKTYNFTMYVKIVNVTNLYGYDIRLRYNATLAGLCAYKLTPPPGWGSSIFPIAGYMAVVGLGPVTPFNGSMTLAVINFTAKVKGNLTIDLSDSVLVIGYPTSEIPYTAVNDNIIISMVGDINGDGKVDLKDVYPVGCAYSSERGVDGLYWHVPPCHRGSPCPHSPNCDLNCDGKIELKDYYETTKNYGKPDP